MTTIDKNEMLEFEILKHVETSPRLNNRLIASKLGCSVKLAHVLLGKMVERGLLHVKKLHSRRWDYFLTPSGISEKARLTYEFLDFSFHFYQDARKESSRVCRELAESGCANIAFLGIGDLAEIVYLGIQEWKLRITAVYDDRGGLFLGYPVLPLSDLVNDDADAVIVCLYDKSMPLSIHYLPKGVQRMEKMHWVFEPQPAHSHKPYAHDVSDTAVMKRAIAFENSNLSAQERLEKFEELQKTAFEYISPKGRETFMRRNMSKRAIAFNQP